MIHSLASPTPTLRPPAPLSSHSEGLIDLLAQSETAEVAILFKEADPTTTRISVRTKPGGVDATVLTGRVRGRRSCPRRRGERRRSRSTRLASAVLAEADRLAAAVVRPAPVAA